METNEFVRSIEIGTGNAKSIPAIVGPWWKEVSKQASSPATPGKLYAIGNYLVELVKNSLSDGKSNGPASTRENDRSSTRGGKVTATFDSEKIKIVIDDLGSEEKEINLNVGGDYGMKESIEYFDVFMIESKGRKYEKNYRNMVEENGDSELYSGSKVTVIKYHVKPEDEYEETYDIKRNFSERM